MTNMLRALGGDPEDRLLYLIFSINAFESSRYKTAGALFSKATVLITVAT